MGGRQVPAQAPPSAFNKTRVRRQAAEDKGAAAWGPITQQQLLTNLGIGPRLDALIQACPDPAVQEALYSGAVRLVAPSSAPAEVRLGTLCGRGARCISSCLHKSSSQAHCAPRLG